MNKQNLQVVVAAVSAALLTILSAGKAPDARKLSAWCHTPTLRSKVVPVAASRLPPATLQPRCLAGATWRPCALSCALAGASVLASCTWRGTRQRRPGSALRSFAGPLELAQRWLLKRDLLALLEGSAQGTKTTAAEQAEIDRLIDALAALNPTAEAGPKLSGRWKLLWTTEKETLALVAGGVLGRSVTEVFQLIDTGAGTLSNVIGFEGGAFEVDSTCEPGTGIRVDFSFNAARVRFGDFALPLPPVGRGWFDCVYIDDELRIVRDSRSDALIAVRE